jgi:hypothetical protein
LFNFNFSYIAWSDFISTATDLISGNQIVFLLPRLTWYILQQVSTALLKVLMHINVFSIGMAYLTKAIHIKLSNKGWKISMFKINRQNFFGKLRDVLYIEAISCWSPTDGRKDRLILLLIRFTSSIYTNLDMNIGICEFLPFLLRLRFILLLYRTS